MSVESNKAALERAVANFAPGKLETYLKLYHADCVFHFFPPGLPPGVEGARAFYGAFLEAFPDVNLVIDDVVGEGDRIAGRYHLNATHKGTFMDVPATGRSVTVTGITILRFDGGACVERWNEADFLGLLRQMGALPG